jgi:molybdopterin/thiamine biosynthesis adenylyltransferase
MSQEREVLVVGAGGLGCAVLPLLAARRIPAVVYDDDVVSLSNLQRQLLFHTRDVGRPKVEVAVERVLALMPGAPVRGVAARLDTSSVSKAVREASLVLDGSDNLPTRFLINDACVLGDRPLVHGGILRFRGQVMSIVPGATACYRCLFEDLPPAGSVPTCSEAGVLGALCGVVGARMVEEAVGLLSGAPAASRIWIHDAKTGASRWAGIGRDPQCAACGEAPSIASLDEARYVERKVG